MELQLILMLCGAGIAVMAVVLLMGLFSTSGTTYEEAIAQQRKATTELLALADNKGKTKKTSKKANKKLAKKEKNKEPNVVATSSELESEAPAESGVDDDIVPESTVKPHVEFRPPVIVDVPADTLPNVKIRKRGKDPKIKPILINKDDPSCVSDRSTPPSPISSTVSNHFEEIHPKDEFELLQSSLSTEKAQEKKEDALEKVEKKEFKNVKQTKPAKSTAKLLQTNEVKEDVPRERQNSGDMPKEQRKGKKDKKDKLTNEEVSETPRHEQPVQSVPTANEMATDKNVKQVAATTSAPVVSSPHAGKGKKKKQEPNVLSLMAGDSGGVNVNELVRVVKEAVLSRTEIQILTDALLDKNHDPLPEHSEWTEGPNDPVQKLKKQLADKEKSLADEIEASQALHAKLKELRATLNAERVRANAAARTHDQTTAAVRAEMQTLQTRVQRLIDENATLAQEKLMLQSKLSAEAEAHAQRVQMEMHIQRLSESETTLVNQLNTLQAELNGRVMEATAAREQMIIAQQHAVDLAQQLQEANRACAEIEQQRAAAAHGEQVAQQEVRQLRERLSGMTELQNEVQRLTTRAQSAESNAEKHREDYEKQKQQLTSELATLKEQLALRESELAELKQLLAAPAQNGLSAANDKEARKEAELAKVESVVQALREELVAAQKSSKENKEQLASLKEQLTQYQDKNNELRTKNWKVMEALQTAEKALQAKSTAPPAEESLREAIEKALVSHYNEVANVLRAACPSAAPSTAPGCDWLNTFADNLKLELQKAASVTVTPSDVNDKRVQEMTEQNEHLQALVDKYKRVIDETEIMLSGLQKYVTTEEERWARQLSEKQQELEELRQRTVTQLQDKIDTLEAELQHARGQNHNHSFADSERLTQERLLGGLSEKHVDDVCNGPSQMAFEK